MTFPVWIDGGNGRIDRAMLAEVPVTGARVDLPAGIGVLRRVVLRLCKAGEPARPSYARWSRGGQVGLHFDRPAVNPGRRASLA